MRLFAGVELDAAVRGRAAAIAEALRLRLGRSLTARWVPADNLHITVWFVGEVADDRAAGILSAIDRPFDVARFDLDIAGLGAFPQSGPPRVFWLGVRTGGGSLARLHEDVGARLGPLGFEPERRPYSAHLTVARIKQVAAGASPGLRVSLGEGAADAGSCSITALTVFRSRPSSKGSAYETLLRVPLQ